MSATKSKSAAVAKKPAINKPEAIEPAGVAALNAATQKAMQKIQAEAQKINDEVAAKPADEQAAIIALFTAWHTTGDTGAFTFPGPVTLPTIEKIAALIKPVRRPPGNGGFKSSIPTDGVIRILVAENPRQVGSAAHERFALLKDGMTVAQFTAACGPDAPRISGTLSKSVRKGWIRIDPPAAAKS